jgi:hypothetical protein
MGYWKPQGKRDTSGQQASWLSLQCFVAQPVSEKVRDLEGLAQVIVHENILGGFWQCFSRGPLPRPVDATPWHQSVVCKVAWMLPT